MNTTSTTPAQSPNILTLLGGIGAIVVGLISLLFLGRTVFQLLDIGGMGFLIEYLALSLVSMASMVCMFVGGLGLISNKNWGWTLAMGACINGVIMLAIVLINYGTLPIFEFAAFDFWTILVLFSTLFDVFFVVVFFLPPVFTALNVKGEHIAIAIAIGVMMVIISYVLRYFIR